MRTKTIDYKKLALDVLSNNKPEKNHVHIGIRSLTEGDRKEVGAILPESYDWDSNDESTYYTTGETLGGASATSVDFELDTIYETKEEQLEELETALQEAIKNNEMYSDYFGKVVIAGRYAEGGEDDNEIIIEDAEVLAIIY